MLHDIPARVQATETPVSFFGDAYIVLDGARPPRDGAHCDPGPRSLPCRSARPPRCRRRSGTSTPCSSSSSPASSTPPSRPWRARCRETGPRSDTTSSGEHLLPADAAAVADGRVEPRTRWCRWRTSSRPRHPTSCRSWPTRRRPATTIDDQASEVRQAIGGGETLTGRGRPSCSPPSSSRSPSWPPTPARS